MSGAVAKSYSASDIEVLEGLEPVRKRPGMYIGSTDTPQGLHHLVFEILDNSVDEAMNGYATEIEVTLHADRQSVTITDNGRGIPVEKHPKFNKSALEVILTVLHAGGKFSDKNYKTAGGLHGVGSSVVNALSEELVATIRRDGRIYSQSYSRGVPVSSLTSRKGEGNKTGTTIFFRPDPQIFSQITFSDKIIRETMRTKAYLNPGVRLFFVDEVNSSREEFHYEEGLVAYLRQILGEKKIQPVGDEIFVIHKNDDVQIDAALAWSELPREEFFSYANGIFTSDGGSHENGAKAGIARALRNYISVHDLLPKGIKLGAEDIREGIFCLVSVRLPGDRFQIQFQGQTKGRLNNPEVAPLVEAAFRSLEQQLNEKPSMASAIVSRIILSAKARAASRAASQSVRRKIGISHRLTLPGKLADCSSTNPEESELFIVEGDSAGGSTKQGRNRHYQAVLPLRGKVLNTISTTTKKAVDNKELSNIVAAVGCGVGKDMDLARLRYGKVIILTDADADGMHIATLLMAFFFKHMRPLIESGNLYIGKSPLYGVFAQQKAVSGGEKKKRSEKSKKKSGVFWAYSDDEMSGIISRESLKNPRIVRYKGLGEMNPDTLWETTLDPETRTMLRVTMRDAEESDRVLTELMGSDPSERSRMIKESASDLTLDV
ncbi:MAG: DNA topoisomerase IV subunit B [bacterium]|nr:DNA topoisomerase IV subunit B [bacterium]